MIVIDNVSPEPHGSPELTLRYHGYQSMYRVVYSFTPQLSLVLMAPTYTEMARLSDLSGWFHYVMWFLGHTNGYLSQY